MLFWHVYVLGGAYFVWPCKSRAPHRDIVTSQRGHWPLLIRVSGITWLGSKLLETLTLVRVTYAHVWARVAGWVGEEEKHTYFCYAYRLYFLTCDMYKSSLRHTWSGTFIIKDERYTFFPPTLKETRCRFIAAKILLEGNCGDTWMTHFTSYKVFFHELCNFHNT
jgi:hypothetical protein